MDVEINYKVGETRSKPGPLVERHSNTTNKWKEKKWCDGKAIFIINNTPLIYHILYVGCEIQVGLNKGSESAPLHHC